MIKKRFFANFAALLSGNVVAQIIQLFGVLFFATVYSTIAFGVLGVSQSLAVIMAAVLTLQLHLMVPLAKNKEAAEVLVGDAYVVSVMLFLALLLGLLLFNKENLVSVLLALVLATNNINSSWLIFSSKFNQLSVFFIVRALLIVFFQYILVSAYPQDGLLYGCLLGELLSAFFLFVLGGRRIIRFSGSGIFNALRARRAFTLYGTIQELVTIAAFYMPLFIFDMKFGSAISGQYAFASRLIWGPLVVVTSSLAQVLTKLYAGESGQGSFHLTHRLALRWLVPVMLVFLAAAYVAWKVSLFWLGDAWAIASEMLGLSIIWGGVFFLSIPYRVMLRVKGLQKYQLMVDAGVMLMYGLLLALPGIEVVFLMVSLVAVSVIQNIALSVIVFRAIK